MRDATASDGAALADIYNPFILDSIATFEETRLTAREMSARIACVQNEAYPYLVAEHDGHVIAYAYAQRWKTRAAYRHTAEISIYVADTAQGKGVGRALYSELFKRLKTIPIHAVIGIITLPNPASVKLHESFGLKKVGHFSEVGRKFDRWIDVGYWEGFIEAD